MPELKDILKQYWGYDQFRPLQQAIIESVIDKKDTLALMPTGGGKSLCYQVPAMALPGLCLVISPLIALMKDQVENLRKRNITAFAIFSGMSRKEVITTLKIAGESNCKFLYVSPERLESVLFKEYLPGLNVQLIAVDEAHCISQWGYDFRPPYLRIAALREELPGIPVLALTASATPEVQEDICSKLAFHKPAVFRQSFERPNLSYSCFKVEVKINKILEVLQKVPGSGIVYCRSRRRTKEISELLKLHKVSADFYHAGLTQEERNTKQESWIGNNIRVMVCTNAFGMGIDKPDVRTVVHADVPDCLENYYQEAGRAGRDGKKSYAVLLYDDRDLGELEQLSSQRFPSIEEVRTVYRAVANYLQIPAGSGEGQYYDFDFPAFLKNFNLKSNTALYSLKTLEQEGWLAFNEQVFLPAMLGFITSKEILYQFENDHPALEPVIKALLRAYGGIFDNAVPVSEKMIAGLLRTDVETVVQQLNLLHQYRLLEYRPQKDNPQLYFMRGRIRAEDLRIDAVKHKKRKEQFIKRVQQMTGYVRDVEACRSRIIGVYFGDTGIKECGTCDNCLRKKSSSVTRPEFEQIRLKVVELLGRNSLTSKQLHALFPAHKKETVWKVIEFLQGEQVIFMDESGNMGLGKG